MLFCFCCDVDGGRASSVNTESTCYLFQVISAHSGAVKFHPRTRVHTHACEPVSGGSRRQPDCCLDRFSVAYNVYQGGLYSMKRCKYCLDVKSVTASPGSDLRRQH